MSNTPQELDYFSASRAAASIAGQRDWLALYRQLGEATLALANAPVVQADPRARGLVRRVAEAKDLEELDCCVELLGLRVSELLGGADGVSQFGTRAGRAAPQALRQTTALDDDAAPARTFIRL